MKNFEEDSRFEHTQQPRQHSGCECLIIIAFIVIMAYLIIFKDIFF